MKNKPYLGLLLFISLLSSVFSNRQLEDFTHAEYLAQEQIEQKARIRLVPQRSILDRFQFPNTWQIVEFLSQSLQKEGPPPQISNIADEISFIKSQTSQFLRLSNKAELLVKNIQQLPQMKYDQKIIVKEDQLKVIEEYEQKLHGINEKINQKGAELEKVVQEMMIQQESPLFKQAELGFERKALKQKINLLNSLKSDDGQKQKAEQRVSNQKRLNDYFLQLNNIFKTESGLIQTIDVLLKSHNELAILKARVTSLSSQLKAHELTLSQKQQCDKQFQKIKQKQRHDREVIKLIQTLKQKKQQFNEPNKYCEGVVKKLIDKVKKLLVGYDYVYECAQGLDLVRENRDKIRKQLDDAQQKLHELQLSRGIDEFRKTFEHNREVVANKVNELKSLQLDDFYRYPGMIDEAVTQAEARIAQIDDKLANLPAKSSYDIASTQNQIVEKVNEIKLLKAQYCKQRQVYNKLSQNIQNKITKFQQQQQYNMWIRKLEGEKLKELQDVKKQMKNIEATILAYIG